MADSLDKILEPGERVLWRDPRGWLPVGWRGYLLMIPGMAVFYAAMVFFGTLAVSPLVGFIILFGAVFLLLSWFACFEFIFDRAVETLVTDRRLLHRTGGRKAAVIEVPLTDIEKVEFKLATRGLVRIARTEGGILRLLDLAEPQPLARALAAAARLPRPALVGPLEHAEFYAFRLCGLPAAIFCGLGVFAIPGQQVGLGAWDLFLKLSLLLPAICLPALAGGLLGTLLSMAILRRRASAEEMRAWLHLGPPEPGGVHRPRWFERPLVAWAALLYGEAMHEHEPAGGTRHG